MRIHGSIGKISTMVAVGRPFPRGRGESMAPVVEGPLKEIR